MPYSKIMDKESVKLCSWMHASVVLPVADRAGRPHRVLHCTQRSVLINDNLLPFACHRGRIIGISTLILRFFAGLRHQRGNGLLNSVPKEAWLWQRSRKKAVVSLTVRDRRGGMVTWPSRRQPLRWFWLSWQPRVEGRRAP